MSISIFTEYLEILATYSDKVDAADVTPDEYIDYQRLEDRLLTAHNRGYFKQQDYKALMGIYYHIKEGFREVLGLGA